jgi:hypothetical protein
MRYINPLTGGFAMPTIGAFLQLLPAAFRAQRIARPTHRVLGGRGQRAREIGEESFDFEPKDTFVVPSWSRCASKATRVRAVLVLRPAGAGRARASGAKAADERRRVPSREYNNRVLVKDHAQYFARWAEASRARARR